MTATVPAVWTEIVTTALLGTTRRPLPTKQPAWAPETPAGASPEAQLLDLAAAHRVAVAAGRLPQRPPAGEAAAAPAGEATAVPAQTLPPAPDPARQLLDGLLGRPEGSTINLWLAACARHGRGAGPEHWSRLAGLASRSTVYDRPLLAAVLGARGRWLVRQNPDWAKLAEALDGTGEPERAAAAVAAAGPDQIARDPQLLLSVPDPWPDHLLDAAFAGLVGGRMGTAARPYARAIGARLTTTQYAELGRSAARFLELPQLTPAQRRGVRSLFVEIERTGFDRIEIDRAFDRDAVRVFKITIPPV